MSPKQTGNDDKNLLDRCSGVLQGMARRDTLILAGDFNAEVHCVPGCVGPCINKSEYHLALDPHSLTRFAQTNELVVLNTWTMKDPCTNYTRTGNSQTDFVMVKPASADQRAKQVKKTEAPFGGWKKEMTHNALVAEVPSSGISTSPVRPLSRPCPALRRTSIMPTQEAQPENTRASTECANSPSAR